MSMAALDSDAVKILYLQVTLVKTAVSQLINHCVKCSVAMFVCLNDAILGAQ